MSTDDIPTPPPDIQKEFVDKMREGLRATLKKSLIKFVLASPHAAKYSALTGEDFKEVVLGMVPEIVDEIRRELCQ
jgi:hypothetical protein